MAIAKMKLLEIEFSDNQYDTVLRKLVHTENFHPELASKFVDSVQGLSVLNRENPYADIINRMEEAKEKYHIDIHCQDVDNTKINIIQADTFFCNVLEQVSKMEKVKVELQQMINENEAAISQLEHMINSEMDFDHFLACKYLKVRFGRIPTINLEKIQYYGEQEFLFKVFHKDIKETYCMYLATETKAPEIDNIFSSLYFESIHIPDFVHGTPEEALKVLKEEDDLARNYLVTLDERIKKVFDENIEELSRIYSISKGLNETYDAQKYVVVFGKNSAIFGFAEEKDALAIKESFENIENVVVQIREATDDSRLTPPSRLKNNWFVRPFGMFVEMYGVPSYTDFDPTTFVALSYTFLFGMMFGDIGQGLLLSLVGFIAYKVKGMKLGEIGMRIGISSALFGIIYGSFFGNEEIFTPMFHTLDPNNTMPLLGIAIGTGVVLIVIAILFNTFTNIKKKDIPEICFSQNGIAGLVFYISVLLMVVKMMLGINIPFVGGTVYMIGLILIPVLLIFLKEPLTHLMEGKKMFPHGFGGFFTEGFFELFDIVLTFITNTMSFLRVGGFVLSHAGMMLVVYTLANMVGGVGYWFVVVFGNIFVMVLEGMIVGIQVLRLEFYEMFSRYYEGKGKPFVSIQ